MRYILDDLGYIEEVSSNLMECNDKGCTAYSGTIPEGYDSLEEWAMNANIRAYKIVNNNLTYDADRDAALQEEWNVEPKDPTCYYDGDTYKIPKDAYINVGGCMTSSRSQIRFGIFLPKSLKHIKSVSVNYAKIAVRNTAGSYILNMVEVTNNIVTSIEGENALYLCYQTSSAMSGTNNTPVSVELNGIDLTFNE